MNKTITKVFCLITIVAFLLVPMMLIAADLTSSDVTVTVGTKRVDMELRARVNDVTIKVINGSKSYPSTGIPMPAATSFGMVRSLTHLITTDTTSTITTSCSSSYATYDETNNTLFLRGAGQSGAVAITTINTNQRIFKGIAIGQ